MEEKLAMDEKQEYGADFIRTIIMGDLKRNKNSGRVMTRFPPEPNGYLHIGHAKSICLNFGIARDFNGLCNLRFDDTNPTKEDTEYVDSIKEDVKWLGFDWDDREYYASDYFEKLYEYALKLIKIGKAYVCELSAQEMSEYRGSLTKPGQASPYRARTVEENLALFERMKNGEFADGTLTLRAKIDMSSPNLNMRDPAVYRIRKIEHHRTGSKWCIYPMYDYAHCLSDSVEGITHSVCTLEFEDHRPLYDWFLDVLQVVNHPQQIEFARLNLTYTVMSKRKLLELVENKIVDGWDDPRMPTLAGLRRRGYTPEAIRDFCERIGVAKANSMVDIALLQHCVREDLNKKAQRRMVVLRPLKVIIDNYPDDLVEYFDAENNPEDETMGTRKVAFGKVIYIERDDFMEVAPPKYYRLSVGKEVRLKYAYYITCTHVLKDTAGQILEVHATYDPASRGGWTNDGRKVKGTSHWVAEEHSFKAEVRLYDHLFNRENTSDLDEGKTLADYANPNSLAVLSDCLMEENMREAMPGMQFQFLRQGYFCVDSKDAKPGKPVFNQTVNLNDSWSKIAKKL